MAVKNCWVEDTVLSLYRGGSVTELSVTDGCLLAGGDVAILAHCQDPLLVNIAHNQKVSDLRAPPAAESGPIASIWYSAMSPHYPREPTSSVSPARREKRKLHKRTPRDAYTEGARAVVFRTPLGSIELAGRSFGGVLWARVECDCRARCCLMDGVDHHLEQGQAFWRNPEASADHHAVIGCAFERLFLHRHHPR